MKHLSIKETPKKSKQSFGFGDFSGFGFGFMGSVFHYFLLTFSRFFVVYFLHRKQGIRRGFWKICFDSVVYDHGIMCVV